MKRICRSSCLPAAWQLPYRPFLRSRRRKNRSCSTRRNGRASGSQTAAQRFPTSLLKRALDVSIEDVWDYLQGQGYRCQFDGGWKALHIDKPFAGRALTAQYMPLRPDMAKAIAAEGKSERRKGDNNSWPIEQLQPGDVYVADGFGKIVEGTLIGSNLGSGIAAHTHAGFIFDAGIRDQEENREIPNLNGFYRGYDPSAWADMTLTAIDAPVRIGRAVVLPGDLVLAKSDGVIFIPAILAEAAISSAEFTNLQDAFNFELNQSGKNGGQFEGGWTPAKYDALAKWVDAHPEKLKMSRAEFNALLEAKKARMTSGCYELAASYACLLAAYTMSSEDDLSCKLN